MADDDQNDNSQDDQFLTNDPDDTNPLADMKDEEELEEDNDTPFSPPTGVQDRIDDTHQVTDTNIDVHERYDAGIEAASGVDLPGETANEDQDLPDAA